MKYPVFTFCLVLSAPLFAAEGDTLTVTGSLVNVRDKPSMVDSVVLMRIREGRAVTEIRREGNWVEVKTGREKTPTGWIYANLLKIKTETRQETAREEDTVEDLVDLFKQALSEYNTRKKEKAGYAYFTDPEYTGEGVIVVTGSRYWLRLPMEQRMEDLSDVFDIWAAAVGEGPSITVNVMDQSGEKQMTMFR